MGDGTKISWSDATWNPTLGCTAVTPGCDNCYAASLASGRLAHVPAYSGLAVGGTFTGEVRMLPDRIDLPLRWTRPRRIFVNSMSDLFHDAVPDDYVADVFAVMALARRHVFQVLTKRHGRMRSLLRTEAFWLDVADKASGWLGATGPGERRALEVKPFTGWTPESRNGEPTLWHPPRPVPNVWLGVSVEDQKRADLRTPALADTPAAVRFLSCEPLLGPVVLDERTLGAVDWIIAGGESGGGARPMEERWARSLREQAERAGVAFHFKQYGAIAAAGLGLAGKGADPGAWPEPWPQEYPA